jgi:hypothetical protein
MLPLLIGKFIFIFLKERIDFPLCANTIDISYLGSGYPLYFNFIKYCVIILFAIFVSYGEISIMNNYYGDSCLQHQSLT